MKKVNIILVMSILFILFTAQAWAAVTRTMVSKDPAGTVSHVTAYVTESGQTVFVIDATTGISIFAHRIDVIDLHAPTSGVSQATSSTSGYIAIYGSSVTLAGTPTISGASLANSPNIPCGVETTVGSITGKVWNGNLTASGSLSGKTVYGGLIGNYGAKSEVTGTLTATQEGMNIAFQLRQDQTSGSTIIVVVNAADSVLGISNFSSGASVIMLSGTTMGSYAVMNYVAPNIWAIQGTDIETRNQ